MHEFLSSLIMPLPVFFALLGAGIFFIWLKKRRTAKILLLVAGCWLLVISTKPVPYILVKCLEDKYDVLNVIPESDFAGELHILVLAAGHSDDESLPPNGQLSGSALGRLTEGVRLHKLYPCSKLILSGPGGKEGYTQADALLRTAIIMGVDSSSILLMRRAKNTSGEAEEYKKLYANGSHLILVTSAIHMPRAMVTFKKAGLNPVPAPTNFIIKHGSRKDPWGWLPSAHYIGMMETALHELAGIVWGKLKG